MDESPYTWDEYMDDLKKLGEDYLDIRIKPDYLKSLALILASTFTIGPTKQDFENIKRIKGEEERQRYQKIKISNVSIKKQIANPDLINLGSIENELIDLYVKEQCVEFGQKKKFICVEELTPRDLRFHLLITGYSGFSKTAGIKLLKSVLTVSNVNVDSLSSVSGSKLEGSMVAGSYSKEYGKPQFLSESPIITNELLILDEASNFFELTHESDRIRKDLRIIMDEYGTNCLNNSKVYNTKSLQLYPRSCIILATFPIWDKINRVKDEGTLQRMLIHHNEMSDDMIMNRFGVNKEHGIEQIMKQDIKDNNLIISVSDEMKNKQDNIELFINDISNERIKLRHKIAQKLESCYDYQMEKNPNSEGVLNGKTYKKILCLAERRNKLKIKFAEIALNTFKENESVYSIGISFQSRYMDLAEKAAGIHAFLNKRFFITDEDIDFGMKIIIEQYDQMKKTTPIILGNSFNERIEIQRDVEKILKYGTIRSGDLEEKLQALWGISNKSVRERLKLVRPLFRIEKHPDDKRVLLWYPS